jgi:hypothetical protein
LVAWGGFNALATALQWKLEQLYLLSPMMATTSYWLGGAILLAGGIWQLTPVKTICLRHCRSPMGLLFFGGVMNLFWIIGLAGFILLEKASIGRIVGVGVAAWGVFLLATTTLTVAAPNAYRFEAAEIEPSGLGKTIITVRLLHVQDKKPVDGAMILVSTTDMGPSGMAEMSGKVTAITSGQPGLYRLVVETGMAGKSELILTAKVQGETEPVTGKITYDAK